MPALTTIDKGLVTKTQAGKATAVLLVACGARCRCSGTSGTS